MTCNRPRCVATTVIATTSSSPPSFQRGDLFLQARRRDHVLPPRWPKTRRMPSFSWNDPHVAGLVKVLSPPEEVVLLRPVLPDETHVTRRSRCTPRFRRHDRVVGKAAQRGRLLYHITRRQEEEDQQVVRMIRQSTKASKKQQTVILIIMKTQEEQDNSPFAWRPRPHDRRSRHWGYRDYYEYFFLKKLSQF
mmetsp:Transcript_10064/g.20792  ORF Transcript_10064/g.20792 Transcript_10064/m.20792 type:complete len:192 (-) Transcript_10064:16-591(-)